MTIVEFLLARIAEDEKPALDLWGGGGKWWAKNADRVMAADLLPAEHAMAVQWDPVRIMAECEAKRRIVAQCGPYDDIQVRRQTRTLAGDTLRLLAAVYSDHPDYDDTWSLI